MQTKLQASDHGNVAASDVNGTQHGVLAHTAWAFLPVLVVNLILITSAGIDRAPWWVVFPVPFAAICICGHQYWNLRRHNRTGLTAEEQRQVLQTQTWRSAGTAAVVSAWGFAMCVYAPDMAHFFAAVAGFTAIGSATYVAYLQLPMRLIFIAVATSLLALALATQDYLSFIIAFCFATNALLLELYLSTHYRTFGNVVSQHVEAQSKYQDSKRAQAEILSIANTDDLTGVMNRRGFLSEVNALIAERSTSGEVFALGVIDLDGFKPVNDCFGHAAGDRVLIEVARRLSAHVGERGALARLGGDEFALLILHPENKDAVLAEGRAAIRALSAPIEFNGQVAQVSASCGFALYPEAGTTAATLLEHADEALYAVKDERRSAPAIYDGRNATAVVRRATIQQRLRRAMGTAEIYLEYQPIVCTETGRLLCYEALARWKDPEIGQVSPGEFIPIAENCGVMGELSRHLLREALVTATTWPSHVGVSFNVSPTSFADNTLALTIIGCLDAAGLSPSRLTIEITESAFASDHERVCEVLDLLRHVGIRVAMDDFGVGYSSFANLDRLPVDILKLDRSFIADVSADTRRQHIVAGIVEMCHKLKLTCVAEGIEDVAQLDFITKIGCNAVQGYLLGRPARPAALTHEIEPTMARARA
ncbi:MAG: EAL domain-containing protein [Hyphomicrobiaceae bacterium]|nr:EAL domain-containing protein [Hyphomicrobiaceae bacterium]